MKREVERERKLPAFSIDIGELETLLDRLVSLFDKDENIYSSIDIILPTEKLEFKNVEELKQYRGLKGSISKFSIWVSSGAGRRVSIRKSGILASQAEVSATGESEAWCAGAVETVYSFFQSYKLWYRWFVSAPLGWALFILINIPNLAMILLPKGAIGKPALIGWLATVATLSFLYIFKGKLFPSATIRITKEESFIRRNSAELGLAIALLSVILTVVGIVINYKNA